MLRFFRFPFIYQNCFSFKLVHPIHFLKRNYLQLHFPHYPFVGSPFFLKSPAHRGLQPFKCSAYICSQRSTSSADLVSRNRGKFKRRIFSYLYNTKKDIHSCHRFALSITSGGKKFPYWLNHCYLAANTELLFWFYLSLSIPRL